MDASIWAAIIGGVAAVLTASIGGSVAIFRDRLHAEKTRSDRAMDDLEDNTKMLEKMVEVAAQLEKRLSQVEFNQRLVLDRLDHPRRMD